MKPADYEAYTSRPTWSLDSPDFEDRESYETHWSATILNWVSQAKKHQDKWKAKCRDALKSIEETEDGANKVHNFEKSLAYKVMDLAYAHVQESTAMLCLNPPQGQLVATQESENQYVAAGNALLNAEFKSNNFDQLFDDIVYEGEFYNLGWIKTSVDYSRFGNYGQKGRIGIERVDADDMYVDPRARRLSWDYMNFIIQESEHEIGDIREDYPVSGFEVADHAETGLYQSVLDERSHDAITSVIPKMDKGLASKRQRIKVYECWFKDSRLKFIPDRETKQSFDEEGQAEYDTRSLKLDADGYVLGDWVPMYPKGRCIVLCEGVILEDMSNRLPHGRCPFIPVPMAPSKNLFVPGDATRIIALHDKINDLVSRAHAYMQSETGRPMHAEFGSFANTQHYKRVPAQPDKVLLLNQGKTGTVLRPPPVELPQSLWELLNKYEAYMDLVAGSSAVMRGAISDGAQLSAEALSSLQTFASSRIALKAKHLAGAIKELTYQVFWLIRRVYDENIKVQVSMPDGSSQTIDWASDRYIFESGDEQDIAEITSLESYLVDIKAGTGTPNGQQARQALMDHLFDRKAIDRKALLDGYEIPDRQNIDQRMAKEETDKLAAESFGRRVGLSVVKAEKDSEPGRKAKYD